jgi:hypothetical protein
MQVPSWLARVRFIVDEYFTDSSGRLRNIPPSSDEKIASAGFIRTLHDLLGHPCQPPSRTDASHAKSLRDQNNLLEFHMPNAEVSHVAINIFSASGILQ